MVTLVVSAREAREHVKGRVPDLVVGLHLESHSAVAHPPQMDQPRAVHTHVDIRVVAVCDLLTYAQFLKMHNLQNTE